MRTSSVVGPAFVALTLSLTGCSVHVGGHVITQISKPALESQVIQAVKEKTGATITDSSCNGPLDGEVGATQRCTITINDGRKYGVNLTTAEVRGEHIAFDFKVDDQPMSNAT